MADRALWVDLEVFIWLPIKPLGLPVATDLFHQCDLRTAPLGMALLAIGKAPVSPAGGPAWTPGLRRDQALGFKKGFPLRHTCGG